MLKIHHATQIQDGHALTRSADLDPQRLKTAGKGRLGAGVGLSALAIAFGAHAAGSVPKAAADDVQLDELVVTAQKREQRLEDVPAAVTVVNSAQLQRSGARSVTDISLLTPGLNAATGGSEATTVVRIRGIGTSADNPGLEDAVGIYIDGVYRPRNSVGFNNLGELAEVEVLKGPQGTLFGKNTVAGVVQITTKRPEFHFGGQAEAEVQTYSGWRIAGSVTGPLAGDVLAGRLFVSDAQRGGYGKLVNASGTRLSNDHSERAYSLRGQLLYKPTDAFDVNLIADYSHRDDRCCQAVLFQTGLPAVLLNSLVPGAVPTPVAHDNTTAVANFPGRERIRDWGVSGQANWTTPWLDGAKMVSITAYRDWRDGTDTDLDFIGADLIRGVGGVQEFKQFSEELRYSGEAGRLAWQVGGFYSHETLDVVSPLQWGADVGPYVGILTHGAAASLKGGGFPVGEGLVDAYHQTEQSFAAYTQDDFRLTDKLTLTAGIRYTSEHKALAALYNNTDTSGACSHFEGVATALHQPLVKSGLGGLLGIVCIANPAFQNLHTHQAFTDGSVTGTVKATYKLTPDAMVYGSYSRGNLAGGFNLAEVTTAVGGAPNASLTPEPNTKFPAENVDAYEVGTKIWLANHRFLVTAEVFFQEYKDFQLNAFTGTQFIEATIPRATTAGVEADGYWKLNSDLTLNGGLTYANTRYPGDKQNRAALGDNTPRSPYYQLTDLFRLPGSHLSFAPQWSLVAGAEYQHVLANGLLWSSSFDVKYQSSYNTGSDHDPVKVQKGFAIANARIGLGSADKRWAVELWAKNLFNQHFSQAIFDGFGQTLSAEHPSSNPAANDYLYFRGEPRFYGATFRIKY
ncbi:MAG: TonB-dependent receptor [Caulobacterales bacterium]|nr:TonB-dependent receptor [Caulobacterales bacterium]